MVTTRNRQAARIVQRSTLGFVVFLTGAASAPRVLAEAPKGAQCADIMPPGDRSDPSPGRWPTPEDLVRLRDIGAPDSALLYERTPLAISPEGHAVAFVLSRAEPATNSYCRALVIVGTQPGPRVRLLDVGGDFISTPPTSLRGLMTPSGFPATIVPRWSPDGRWLAYLRRDNGVTQVWRVSTQGDPAAQVTHSRVDVEEVGWTEDSTSLVLKMRPDILTAQRQITADYDVGYRYDEAFVPGGANRPRVRGPIPSVYTHLELGTGRQLPASAEDRKVLDPPSHVDGPRPMLEAISRLGAVAWSVPRTPALYSPMDIWTRQSGGAAMRCPFEVCSSRLIGLWWSPDGREVWFERTEGWGGSQIGFYLWAPNDSEPPRRTLSTTDSITGCVPADSQLVCLRDSATRPRRLVTIDPGSGQSSLLFDPNPEFSSLRLGTVKRLEWTNKYGARTFGDLITPPDHKPGQKLPLIVVQYMNRGFLRGGTGDEFPIFPFVGEGYAVLTFNRVPQWSELNKKRQFTSPEQAERFNTAHWMNRRNQATAVLAGVRAAIRSGDIDETRIGLTGLSDGSTTAQYLLVNSRLFSAASLAACCMEPVSTMINGGEAWSRQLMTFGYPGLGTRSNDFWRPLSFAVSGSRVRTPVMFNIADDEYPIALPSYEALRANNLPVSLWIYPDEHHIIWQPAHRLEIYKRNLAWFGQWLMPRAAH